MNSEQMLEYDEWATGKLLDAVSQLSLEQFVHEFSGDLSSVRQQFVHLLSVADRYRARLMQEPVPVVTPEDFLAPRDLTAYAARVRRRLAALKNTLATADLDQMIEHETRRGIFHTTVAQTIQHMINHATYHRGQIACLLKLHGVDFADTDYIIWLNRT